ncbi:hypothetical protein ACFFX0_32640 [Citricoccus parietis]|uniref:Uncharacterized protein n=1 Tax=Citricoccus parietis TaxID=592307 RepID=A0ABV5G9M3_9MICC
MRQCLKGRSTPLSPGPGATMSLKKSPQLVATMSDPSLRGSASWPLTRTTPLSTTG